MQLPRADVPNPIQPRTFYFREAIEYSITMNYAILDLASKRHEDFLFNMQRYIEQFPAAGEIVIFDRSWYNRAGVEHVMGFVSEEGYRRFLKLAPRVEKYIVDAGIILIKFWLEVGKEEQERRFLARINDPMRQWKLSPMQVPSPAP